MATEHVDIELLMIVSMEHFSSRSTWFSMNDMPAVESLHGPRPHPCRKQLEVVDGDAFDPLSGLPVVLLSVST